MKIFGSTQYVNLSERVEPWYQLEVINMWDWKTKAICFKYAGKTLISYCLKLNTVINENSYTSIPVEDITDEMKNELLKMGYTLK